MGRLTNILDKYIYPEFQDNWDNKLFRDRVIEHINSNSRILDLGAGAGIIEHCNFKGLAASVCGVDLDNRVLKNPYLDDAKLGSAEAIPYDDQAFDIVICNNVLEHLSNPAVVFKEVSRVLKKGGFFIVKTPNKFHYVPLLARLTPHWFHQLYNSLRGRQEDNTFPTLYKVNSKKKIYHYSRAAGFEIRDMRLIEGRPEYLRIIWPAYLGGMFYEKLVNSMGILKNFRVIIIAALRKR
jgi:ubiquinone/menaquinone biosynthesis C-methylase UbiE